jgi:hypothetical protein
MDLGHCLSGRLIDSSLYHTFIHYSLNPRLFPDPPSLSNIDNDSHVYNASHVYD